RQDRARAAESRDGAPAASAEMYGGPGTTRSGRSVRGAANSWSGSARRWSTRVTAIVVITLAGRRPGCGGWRPTSPFTSPSNVADYAALIGTDRKDRDGFVGVFASRARWLEGSTGRAR